MKSKFTLSALTLAVGLSSAGCSLEAGSEEQVGRSEAAVGEELFVYFRSNATGWGVDDATRLGPFTPTPNIFAREYAVTEPWMVSGADTAVVTVTNQLNGWGTRQDFLGASEGLLIVPDSDRLASVVETGNAHFQIKYPALGTYRVVTNFNQTPSIFVEAVP